MAADSMFKFPMWQYRTTLTQTDALGGDVVLDIKPNTGNKLYLIFLSYAPAVAWAAARTVDIHLIDGSGNVIAVLDSNSITSGLRHFPYRFGSDSAILLTPMKFEIAHTDQLRIKAAALAQNEAIIVNVRGIIMGKAPDLSTASSTGTVTKSDDYNRVV